MNEPFLKDSYNEKLTRVYVALAMAQDATKRWVDQKPEYEPLKGLVTTLDVTTKLLEEILEQALPEKISITSAEISYPELIM
jgi:CRISPR/Cas system-associated protein endoribonuclease Cas2